MAFRAIVLVHSLVFRSIGQFRCLEPSSLVQAFRATFLSLGIQNHFFQFRHSEPPYIVQAFRAIFLNQVFRATLLSLGIQTHLPQLGIQSHFYQLKHAEPPSSIQGFRATLFSLGIQSYLAQLGVHSHLPQLGVQSHFLNQAFRVTSLAQAFKSTSLIEVFRAISSNFRRSEPLLLVRCSKPFFSIQAFKAIFSSLGIQSHIPQLCVRSHPLLQFRPSKPQFRHLELHFSVKHSDPPSSLRPSEPLCSVPLYSTQVFRATSPIQAFRATIFLYRRLDLPYSFRHSEPFLPARRHSHFFQFRHSKPQFQALRAISSSFGRLKPQF